MTNHFPRTLLVLLLVIIAAAFLVGTSRGAPVVSVIIATPTLTEEQLGLLDIPAPTPPPSMISTQKPADTTGMVIGAALVTLIILAGAFWGWRTSLPRIPRPPRPPRPSTK